MTGCRARSTSLLAHMNLFWQLWRNGNSHGLGTSHAFTPFPIPSFRVPLSVGNAMVCRGNAGWTTSKSGHPSPSQNCPRWPPTEKDRKRNFAESPLMAPWWPNQSRNWIEQIWHLEFGVGFDSYACPAAYLLVNGFNQETRWKSTSQMPKSFSLGGFFLFFFFLGGGNVLQYCLALPPFSLLGHTLDLRISWSSIPPNPHPTTTNTNTNTNTTHTRQAVLFIGS